MFGQVYTCVGVETQAKQNPSISILFSSGQKLNSRGKEPPQQLSPRLLVLIPRLKTPLCVAGGILIPAKANRMAETEVSFFSSD